MTPAPAACPVRSHVAVDREVELLGEAAHDADRHVGRVFQEGAEEAHGAELDRAAEAHMGAAVPRHEGVVGVVKVEVAGQLFRTGVAGKAAVPALLILGEEADRHGGRSPLYTGPFADVRAPSSLRARGRGRPLLST